MAISRAKAIREKCIDCMCGQRHEVKLCPASDCALFPYRLGHVSKTAYSLTPEADDKENPAKNA